MKVEDILEAEYFMLEVFDLDLGQRIEPPSFGLNAKLFGLFRC